MAAIPGEVERHRLAALRVSLELRVSLDKRWNQPRE
jgi:hypothetical protein